jgi:hypothetical protein
LIGPPSRGDLSRFLLEKNSDAVLAGELQNQPAVRGLIFYSLPTGGGGSGWGGNKSGTPPLLSELPNGFPARRLGATDPAFFGKRTRMRHSHADRTGGRFRRNGPRQPIGLDEPTMSLWLSDPASAASSDSFSCKKGGIGPPFRLSSGFFSLETGIHMFVRDRQCLSMVSLAPRSGSQAGNSSSHPSRGWPGQIIFSFPTGGGETGLTTLFPPPWWGMAQSHNSIPSPLVGNCSESQVYSLPPGGEWLRVTILFPPPGREWLRVTTLFPPPWWGRARVGGKSGQLTNGTSSAWNIGARRAVPLCG